MRTMLVFCLILCAQVEAGENWPAFLGAGSSETSTRELPIEWSPTENIAWRTRLSGYGQSSPVIWNQHIYATSVDGAKKETNCITALSTATGEQLWSKTWTSSQTGANNPMTSRAAPTPVADEQGVYVFFESGDLIGLSHAGEVRWQRSLVEEFGPIKNHHGLGSSLAQTPNAVIVLVDHTGPSYLLAVDKITGRDLWRAERKSNQSWSSPLVVELAGQTRVLTIAGGTLICYDAASGKECWQRGGFYSNDIPSPVVVGQDLYLAGGINPIRPRKDEAVTTNCRLQLSSAGAEPLWRDDKLLAYHASPVVHNRQIYLVARSGVLHCLDAATGTKRYVARLANSCWATPIAHGEHLYLFGKDGVTSVIKTGSTFELVAENRLWREGDYAQTKTAALADPQNKVPLPPASPEQTREMEAVLDEAIGDVVYAAAAVDGAIYLRTGGEVFCIRDLTP